MTSRPAFISAQNERHRPRPAETPSGNTIQMPNYYTTPTMSSLYYLLRTQKPWKWTPQTVPGMKNDAYIYFS